MDDPRALLWNRRQKFYESRDKNVRVIPLYDVDLGFYEAAWSESFRGSEAEYTVLEALYTTRDKAEVAANDAWDKRWA